MKTIMPAVAMLVLVSVALGQTDIDPDQGLEHVGQSVRVTFTVPSMGRAGESFELNSRASWKEPNCFLVHLSPAVQMALKEKGVANLPGHFARKKIAVTGTVKEISPGGMKRASILVSSVDDIRIVEPTDEPKPSTESKIIEIEPTQGLDHVGKKVRVRMFVTSIGGAGDSQVLNSAKDWNVPGNLQVILPPDILAAYRADGIEKPNLHFWHKNVEVTGVVREIAPGGMKVPAIKIESRDDLRFILVSIRQAPKIGGLLDRRIDLQLKSEQFLADVLVTAVETRGDPIGILNLKVRSDLLITDLDPASAQQYLKYLDSLYDEMCRAFAIPLGKNIWAGKCIVGILLEIDPNKFRRYFVGTKEGLAEEESLQQAFHMTHTDLARLYGRRIGVPDLKP